MSLVIPVLPVIPGKQQQKYCPARSGPLPCIPGSARVAEGQPHVFSATAKPLALTARPLVVRRIEFGSRAGAPFRCHGKTCGCPSAQPATWIVEVRRTLYVLANRLPSICRSIRPEKARRNHAKDRLRVARSVSTLLTRCRAHGVAAQASLDLPGGLGERRDNHTFSATSERSARARAILAMRYQAYARGQR